MPDRPDPSALGVKEHVHDRTGPTMTCPCGFKFEAARFCFSLDVFDNQTKQDAIKGCHFNTDSVVVIANRLEEAARMLRKIQ